MSDEPKRPYIHIEKQIPVCECGAELPAPTRSTRTDDTMRQARTCKACGENWWVVVESVPVAGIRLRGY